MVTRRVGSAACCPSSLDGGGAGLTHRENRKSRGPEKSLPQNHVHFIWEAGADVYFQKPSPSKKTSAHIQEESAIEATRASDDFQGEILGVLPSIVAMGRLAPMGAGPKATPNANDIGEISDTIHTVENSIRRRGTFGTLDRWRAQAQ